MENFFGINYWFEKEKIHLSIDKMITNNKKGYICVADGVTLAMSHKNKRLRETLDKASIITCDSGWVPLYLKKIYNIEREQYCGADLLMNLVKMHKYRMMFLGSSQKTLDALKQNLTKKDQLIDSMFFYSLPYKDVDEFDYQEIADFIKKDNPDIIFFSLGMPKQEFFMNKLEHYIEKGILIGVGAAFKFHSGLLNQKRAPKWMIKAKIEWMYRIISEPQKQLKRCSLILFTMPAIYREELKRKKQHT